MLGARSTRARRTGATVGAVAMTLALLPAAAATAQDGPRSLDPICPPPGMDAEDQPTFSDDGSVHDDAIRCAAAYELVQGIGGDRYAPNATLTRGQMATIIRGLVETATGEQLPAGEGEFTDVDGTTHQDSIEALAATGVVQGFNDDTYRPNDDVRRDQMASFIARAIDFADSGEIDGSQPPAGESGRFDDVDGDNVHSDAIEALAEVGVVAGRTTSTYDPAASVARGATATFAMRGGSFLDSVGGWAPTDPEQVGAPILDGRPELVGVSTVSTSSASDQATVRYQFDSELDPASVIGTGFTLYERDTNQVASAADSDRTSVEGDVRVDPNDPSAVLAVFSVAEWQRATVAAVEPGAALSLDGDDAAPQSLPLKGVQLAAGETLRPDLVSATIRTADDGTVIVDYRFDTAISSVGDASDFLLVRSSGNSSGATEAGETIRARSGNTISVTFDTDQDGGIARAGVNAGAVTAASGSVTHQVVDVSDSGTTSAPDLVTIATDPVADQVTFTFDTDVEGFTLAPGGSDPDAGAFRVFDARGVEVAGEGIDDVDGRDVTVAFDEGAISDLIVGATVEAGQVRAFGATSFLTGPGNANGYDGVTVEVDIAVGETFAPLLDGAELATTAPNDPLADATGIEVTYTFDSRIDSTLGTGTLTFALYGADGLRTVVDVDDCAVDDPTEVVCAFDVDADERDRFDDAVAAGIIRGSVRDADTGVPSFPQLTALG